MVCALQKAQDGRTGRGGPHTPSSPEDSFDHSTEQCLELTSESENPEHCNVDQFENQTSAKRNKTNQAKTVLWDASLPRSPQSSGLATEIYQPVREAGGSPSCWGRRGRRKCDSHTEGNQRSNEQRKGVPSRNGDTADLGKGEKCGFAVP